MVGHDNLVLHPYPGKRDGLCHTFPQRGENEGRRPQGSPLRMEERTGRCAEVQNVTK